MIWLMAILSLKTWKLWLLSIWATPNFVQNTPSSFLIIWNAIFISSIFSVATDYNVLKKLGDFDIEKLRFFSDSAIVRQMQRIHISNTKNHNITFMHLIISLLQEINFSFSTSSLTITVLITSSSFCLFAFCQFNSTSDRMDNETNWSRVDANPTFQRICSICIEID